MKKLNKNLLSTSHLLEKFKEAKLLVIKKFLSDKPDLHSQKEDFSKKQTFPSFFEVPQRVKVALVLGSGAQRGLAHVGVIEALEKENIPIDLIVGCSSGSIVGALYAHYLDSHFLKSLLCPLKKKDLLELSFSNLRYGLSEGKGLQKFLKKHLGNMHFDQLKIPFIAVATDLDAGELVSIGGGEIIPAILASSAVPFFFTPVKWMGYTLVDGGVVNTVPVDVAKQYDPMITIAVDVTDPLSDAFASNVAGVVKRSAEIKLKKHSEVCAMNADIVIKPQLFPMKPFDDRHNDKIYQTGKEATIKALPQILKLLEEKKISHSLETAMPCSE